MSQSKLEFKFHSLWQKYCPDIELTAEAQIIPGRRFRFDFVHYPTRVAIEINGGTYAKTRYSHSSGSGIYRDYNKSNLAQIKGFYVFNLDSKMITKKWVQLIGSRIRYMESKKKEDYLF